MNRTRNHQFSIRLTADELALFEKKRTVSGLSKTDFFLKMLRSTKVQVYWFSEAIRILYTELRRIGVNLNQIAYLVNIEHDSEAKYQLHQMNHQYAAVLDRLKHFLDHPLVNAYIIKADELSDLNPLGGESCRSET